MDWEGNVEGKAGLGGWWAMAVREKDNVESSMLDDGRGCRKKMKDIQCGSDHSSPLTLP